MKRGALLVGFLLLSVAAVVAAAVVLFPPIAEPQRPSSAPAAHDAASPPTATVFGEIRRVGGALVAAQRVALVDARGAARETTTDAQGVFRFEGVAPNDPCELRVDADGCAPIRVAGLTLQTGELQNLGAVRLGPAARARIRVVSWADESIAGARVDAFRRIDHDRQAAAPPNATATTDAVGEALIDGLADGLWTFVARAPGFAQGDVAGARVRAESIEPFTIRLGLARKLDGRVLDPDGRPVADATVHANADLADVARHHVARTDAAGRFAFDDIAAGETVLGVARGDGRPPILIAKVRSPDVSHVDLRLRRGARVRGHVLDADTGAAIAGATVRLGVGGEGPSHSVRAVTDERGAYVVDGIVETVREGEALRDGFVGVIDRAWTHPAFTPTDGDEFVRDFRVRRGARLAGVVASPTGPVSGAYVHFRGGASGFDGPYGAALSDPQGRYEFACVPIGAVRVGASKAGFSRPTPDGANERGYLDEPIVIDVAASGANRQNLLLAPNRAVEGRVVARDATPIAGVDVSIYGAPDSTVTNADGAFRVEGVRPGGAWLECRKVGFEILEGRNVQIGHEVDVRGVVVKMQALGAIQGRVRTADGVVPPDALVGTASWNERHGTFESGTGREPTSRAGDFVVRVHRDRSRFALRAVAPGFAPATSAAVDQSDASLPSSVVLVLEPGVVISGHVVAAEDRAPVVGAFVYVAPRSEWFSFRGAPMDAVAATTDEDGAFRIEHLTPGKYVVGAESLGRASSGADADAPNGDGVEIALARNSEIKGRVRSTDRRPAEGLQVLVESGRSNFWFDDPGEEWTRGIVDAEGRFRIARPSDRRYALFVDAPMLSELGVVRQRVPDVAAGGADVMIAVDEGATISGRVLGADRSPLADVDLTATPTNSKGADFKSLRRAKSRADGTFVVRGLAGGTFDLEADARPPFQRNVRRTVRIADVKSGTAGLEVVLAEGLSISGTIVDAAGTPLSGVFLWAAPVDKNAPGAPRGSTTDVEGKFQIPGLDAGAYRIETEDFARPPAFVLAPDATADAGAAGVLFTATKAVAIVGVVVDEAGAPIAGAHVSASCSAHHVHVRVESAGDGTFALRGLRAGDEHRVEATSDGRVDAREDKVRGGAELRLVLAKGRMLSGRILNADGKPLATTRIGVFSAGFRSSRFTTTDANGLFRVDGLAEGAVDVTAFPVARDGTKLPQVPCGAARAGDVGVDLRAQ